MGHERSTPTTFQPSCAIGCPGRRSSSFANVIRTAFGADSATPATVSEALHCEPARGSTPERYHARTPGARGMIDARAARWPREDTMATSSEMAPAESVSPVGLAAYQQGAVVSRTLLKRAG